MIIGIYLLKRKNKVVYVGQSKNVHRRIGQHKDKTFDSYEIIECSESLLNCTEEFYILSHNPIYNKKRAEIKVSCNSMKEKRKINKIKKEIRRGYKHLRIKEDTHKLVKAYASIEGVNVDTMVKKLIEAYKGNFKTDLNKSYRR